MMGGVPRKVTDDDVRTIRGLWDRREATQVEIAAQFGISRQLVSFIARREKHADVLDEGALLHRQRVDNWRDQLGQAQEQAGEKGKLSHWVAEQMVALDIPLPEDRWIVGLKGVIVISDAPLPPGNSELHARHVIMRITNNTLRYHIRKALGLPPAEASTTETTTGPSRAQVRLWARDNGYQLGRAGNIPSAIQNAYAEAHPDGGTELVCGGQQGKFAGASRHYRASQELCEPCREAVRRYKREQARKANAAPETD